MIPERFHQCLWLLGWSQRQFGMILSVHFRTVQRWANGQETIPSHVAAWLERLAACHEDNPLPVGWQKEGPPC